LGIACSDVPDLDGIGYRLGIPYESVLGHRGLTHSLLVAGALALLLARWAAGSRASHRQLACAGAYLFACTASHGVLDGLTNGGLGVAFFAPFSAARFFLPWRPIEVSPLGVARFLSHRGLEILCSELLWVWLPSLLIGALGFLMIRRSAEA